jgi:transaldolase
MRLFLDTADIDEIREINAWGVLSGVTTNPSLVAKTRSDADRVWKEILAEVDGDISLETTELEADAMFRQGLELAKMGPNAVVKVPMTPDGLKAGRRLVDEGIRINVTLVFSPAQAILAAEIGAYCVSPFLGRLDDVSSDGMYLLRQMRDLRRPGLRDRSPGGIPPSSDARGGRRARRRRHRDDALRGVQQTREAPTHR